MTTNRHKGSRKPPSDVNGGNLVWDDEALHSRPYVRDMLRRMRGKPTEEPQEPPADHNPVVEPPEVKPGPPERPELPEGQCSLCCQIKPLQARVGGELVCTPCALEGLDRQRLEEVLEEERLPHRVPRPAKEIRSISAKPQAQGEQPMDLGRGGGVTAGVPGTVYLACFERSVGSGARHYLGWTKDVEARVQAHANGKGAKLMSLVCALGVGWKIVRTWPGLTRHDERKMKQGGSLARYCPGCRGPYRERRNRLQRIRRARDGRADRPRGNPRGPVVGRRS